MIGGGGAAASNAPNRAFRGARRHCRPTPSLLPSLSHLGVGSVTRGTRRVPEKTAASPPAAAIAKRVSAPTLRRAMPPRQRAVVALETGGPAPDVTHTADGGCVASGGAQASSLALARVLLSCFLPAGFPDSVAPGYARYQLFDSLQGLCSYVRGVAASAALLRALGVGSAAATPLGAATQWVLRDATGMVASLALASTARMDADAKAWRLAADVANDAALVLDAASPLLAGRAFAMAVVLSSIARALTGVAGGATRAALTAHFARAGNAADVAAKEGTQETAVTLVGMVLGWMLAKAGAASPRGAALLFAALTAAHVLLNVAALRCLVLPTLNQSRALIVLRCFAAGGAVPTPAAVAAVDPLTPPPLRFLLGPRPPHVLLGASLAAVAEGAGCSVAELVAAAPAAAPYVAAPAPRGARVALAAGAAPADVLQGHVHGLLLAGACGPGLERPASAARWMARHWPALAAAAEGAGWALDRCALAPGDRRFVLGSGAEETKKAR